MNPLEQKVEELTKRVAELEQAQNLNAIDSFMQVIVKDIPTVTDADVTLSVSDSVGAGGGTVNFDILDFPDRWIVLRYGGELHRIPSYLERLDSSR